MTQPTEYLQAGSAEEQPRRGPGIAAVALLAAVSGFAAHPLIHPVTSLPSASGPVAAAQPESSRSSRASDSFRTGTGDCEVTVHGRYPLHPDCFSSRSSLNRWLGVERGGLPRAGVARAGTLPMATCRFPR
jgi:hypothetical protein